MSLSYARHCKRCNIRQAIAHLRIGFGKAQAHGGALGPDPECPNVALLGGIT